MLLRRIMACMLMPLSCTALAQNAPLPPFSNAAQLASLQDDEKRLWDESADADKGIRRRGSLYGDVRVDDYLQSLIDELYPEFKGGIRVRVVNDPDLNAFAMPNGSIYINLGLLARLGNEAQLAAVLAHEGAHFIQRHGYQRRENAKGVSAFALGIGLVGGIVGALGQLAAVSSIYGFSREHEHEADRVGFDRIVKQGYDTQQGIRVFELLSDEARLLDYKQPFMFASHPKLDDRVQSFRDLRAANPAAATLQRTEEERFLRMTSEVRLAWITQALGMSRYKSVVYVLEQADVGKRFPASYPYYLGEAYRLRNETDDQAKALVAYRQAIGNAPGFAPSYRALGMLDMTTGDKDGARSMFLQYLSMSPDATDAGFIKSYLEQIQ